MTSKPDLQSEFSDHQSRYAEKPCLEKTERKQNKQADNNKCNKAVRFSRCDVFQNFLLLGQDNGSVSKAPATRA